MTPIVLGVFRGLLPALVAAPIAMVRAHIGAVTYAEKQRSLWSVLVFVHLAGRVDNEGARHYRNRFSRCSHGASAGKAEIDFGGMWMAVIRADLAGLPASHGEVTLSYFAEDFLDMVLRVPLLLTFEAEDLHGAGAPGELDMQLSAITD